MLEHVIKYYKENNFYEQYKEQLEYVYTRYAFCSSLLRIVKIKDKQIKKKLLKETWDNVNNKFPHWKQNPILKRNKTAKDLYMKTINKVTYKIYCTIFSLI